MMLPFSANASVCFFFSGAAPILEVQVRTRLCAGHVTDGDHIAISPSCPLSACARQAVAGELVTQPVSDSDVDATGDESCLSASLNSRALWPLPPWRVRWTPVDQRALAGQEQLACCMPCRACCKVQEFGYHSRDQQRSRSLDAWTKMPAVPIRWNEHGTVVRAGG